VIGLALICLLCMYGTYLFCSLGTLWFFAYYYYASSWLFTEVLDSSFIYHDEIT
jgi:hypothetical protein